MAVFSNFYMYSCMVELVHVPHFFAYEEKEEIRTGGNKTSISTSTFISVNINVIYYKQYHYRSVSLSL